MLAQRLRQLRKDKSLTLQQVAQQLGVTRACVSKWETGTSKPDLARLEELANLLGLSLSDLLRSASSTEPLQSCRTYPVVSLSNGVPIQALREASQWRHPSPRRLPDDAFFVALGGYMVAHFGLSDVPRDALLLVDPCAKAQAGDLVLVNSKSMGYQVLAAREHGGLLEYVSLGIKLAHVGAFSDASVAGVVLEAVSTLNLRSYALTKAPQLMLA
jgi:transcriptional regulator with XRE-family HTH domain